MPSKQFARGIVAGYAATENPFSSQGGMEGNLRLIDDLLGAYTLLPPQPAGTPYPVSPAAGSGQIYSDGSFAVFNAGSWRNYGAKPGLTIALADGSRSWICSGHEWTEQVDQATVHARDEAVAARDNIYSAERIKVDTAAGIAATTNGQYFFVPFAAASKKFFDLYLNNAGAALYINTYPSTSALAEAVVRKLTLAALNADLSYAADTTALVSADGDPDQNGVYQKLGGVGAGSWVKSDFGKPLPDSLQQKQPTRATDVQVQTLHDGQLNSKYLLAQPPQSKKTYEVAPGPYTVKTLIDGQIWMSFLPGTYDGLPAGTLTRIILPAGVQVNADAKFQLAIYRARGGLPAAPAATTFDRVALAGEIPVSPAAPTAPYFQNRMVLGGLSIPVLGGDLVAVRGINCAPLLGADPGGVTAYNNDIFFVGASGDLSLDGMPAVLAAASGYKTRLVFTAEVMPGAYVPAEGGPGSAVRLDEEARIPASATRKLDSPWAGLKVGVVGTSITAGVGADAPYELNGYIAQMGRILNCDLDNQAVSSSTIARVSGGGLQPIIALSNTPAEANAAGGGTGFEIYSYQNKIIGKGFKGLIFDHGYNDFYLPLGTIDSMDRSTFLGAMNFVITAALNDNPTLRIILMTPPHTFGTVSDPSAATDSAGHMAVRQAIFNLGEKWRFPVFDTSRVNGLNPYTVQHSAGLPDGVHPGQWVHNNIARGLAKLMNGC